MIYRKMHFKRNSNNPTSSPTIKHQDLLKPRKLFNARNNILLATVFEVSRLSD